MRLGGGGGADAGVHAVRTTQIVGTIERSGVMLPFPFLSIVIPAKAGINWR